MLTKVSRSLIEDGSITPEKLALNNTGSGNVLVVNASGELELNEGVDLSQYALITYVDEQIANSVTNGTLDLSNYVTNTDLTYELVPYALKTELFSGSYNDLTDIPVISYNDLSDTPVIPTVPTNISEFTNDSGYLTTHQDLSQYALKTELFSGSYNDLTDTPTTVSAFTNDAGYLTTYTDTTYTSGTGLTLTGTTFAIDSTIATNTYVDTAISNLINGADAAFDTLKEIQDAMSTDTELATAINNLVIPGDISELTDTTNLLNHFSGDYNDLTNKPTIPTNISSLTNDSDYVQTSELETVAFSGLYNDLLLKPALFSGSWDDLTDKPALFTGSYTDLTNKPELFDGQYSSLVGYPTNVSTFNNDAGYITSFTDTTYSAGTGLDLTGTVFSIDNTVALKSEIPTVPTTVSSFTNDIGYITDYTVTQADVTAHLPTNVSAFTNDAGYITDYTVTQADVTAHQAALSVTESQITDLNNYVKHSTDDHVIPDTDNTWDLGSTTNMWRTVYGHTVEATYADLAERYAADAPYDEGTVLVFGGEAEVTACTMDTDVRVAGIVSVNPGLKLNSEAGNSQTHPYIALKGRVPCKVIGPVKKGDLLVTSDTPGYARSVVGVDMGHAILGKSLVTDLSGGVKLIEVFVV